MHIATRSRAQSPCVVRTSTLAQAGLGTFPAQRDPRPVHRSRYETDPISAPPLYPGQACRYSHASGLQRREKLPNEPKMAATSFLAMPYGESATPGREGTDENTRKTVKNREKP